MAPLPAKVVPRIQQLIRLLASDQDGEVLNAVRAIGKTLAAEGKTFHDLANALDGPVISGRRPKPTRTPTPDPPPFYKSKPRWRELRGFEMRDWLTVFLDKMQLSSTQRTTISSYRVKLNIEQPMSWQPSKEQLRLSKELLDLAWRTGLRP